jgi:F-type H+-transporting ATPase subunit a
MYSPFEQFEPLPFFVASKMGFFYVLFTNVTLVAFIMYAGLFFFFNGPFVRANAIKYDNNVYADFYSVRNYNIFFHKDSFFVGFDYLSNFYRKKVFSFFSSIKSSSPVALFYSFLYKTAAFSVFINRNLLGIKSSRGAYSDFYSSFLEVLKRKSFDTVLTSEFSRKLSGSFLSNVFVKNKFNVLASHNSNISKDSNALTISFLRHIILVSFFFKKLVSNVYVYVFQGIYAFALDLITSTFCAGDLKKSLRYFPFFFSLFSFILFLNCIGLIPYSSTVTSYACVTLLLTFMVLFGAYYLVFSIHGLKFFSLFCPQGCPFGLIFFLIPIEFISYVFRMVSLSARLFANMMAGHALLAVLTGFSWVMFNSSDVGIVAGGTLPMIVVFMLFFLETGIAIVQAIVFTILSCMYIDEAINLSH